MGRILRMRPGDRLCYFTGYLPAARLSLAAFTIEACEEAKRVDKLARFMLRAGLPGNFKFAAESEPVHGLNLGRLTQERVKPFVYDYYFTRT